MSAMSKNKLPEVWVGFTKYQSLSGYSILKSVSFANNYMVSNYYYCLIIIIGKQL